MFLGGHLMASSLGLVAWEALFLANCRLMKVVTLLGSRQKFVFKEGSRLRD